MEPTTNLVRLNAEEIRDLSARECTPTSRAPPARQDEYLARRRLDTGSAGRVLPGEARRRALTGVDLEDDVAALTE